MAFRDDGDALLARNAALEAENARLRDENAKLKEPAEPPPDESRALVRKTRKTPQSIEVHHRVPWWRRGYSLFLYVIAIGVAIWQGVL